MTVMEHEAIELNYKTIGELLGDDNLMVCVAKNGEHIIVECVDKDEDGSPIFRTSMAGKRTDYNEWWVMHYYYGDGTVEELYEAYASEPELVY